MRNHGYGVSQRTEKWRLPFVVGRDDRVRTCAISLLLSRCQPRRANARRSSRHFSPNTNRIVPQRRFPNHGGLTLAAAVLRAAMRLIQTDSTWRCVRSGLDVPLGPGWAFTNRAVRPGGSHRTAALRGPADRPSPWECPGASAPSG